MTFVYIVPVSFPSYLRMKNCQIIKAGKSEALNATRRRKEQSPIVRQKKKKFAQIATLNSILDGFYALSTSGRPLEEEEKEGKDLKALGWFSIMSSV